MLEPCRGYGFPAVGEVIGGVSFAALQGGGFGKSRTKDAAILRLFRGQVGQSRIGLGPRSSMRCHGGQVGRPLLDVAHEVVAPGWAEFDLSRPETLLAATLDDLAPELIINPAAYTAVDRAEDERDLAFLVNATAPGVRARYRPRRAGSHSFIFRPITYSMERAMGRGAGIAPPRRFRSTGPASSLARMRFAGPRGRT